MRSLDVRFAQEEACLQQCANSRSLVLLPHVLQDLGKFLCLFAEFIGIELFRQSRRATS
jgi:hypothetical protein